jgi:plastocyanin
MIVTRRRAIEVGAGLFAALAAAPAAGSTPGTIEIAMRGRPDGSAVWFDPYGVHVLPGQTVRWTNRDRGNAHTVTAYHPQVLSRPRRIPVGALPWNSDYLLPDESFSLRLTKPGVYDYYCIPHEHAGMVGRIVVGDPPPGEAAEAEDPALTPLPEAALKGFPAVEDILARRLVHQDERG